MSGQMQRQAIHSLRGFSSYRWASSLGKHSIIQTIPIGLGLASVYFLAARLGLVTALYDGNISPIWPATGIAIAGVYIWGYRIVWAVGLGAALFTISTGQNTILILGSVFVSTLEAIGAVYLIRKFIGNECPFRNSGNVFRYVFLGGLLPTGMGAIIAIAFFCYGGLAPWNSYWYSVLTFWLGDLMGALLVVPFILTWRADLSHGLEQSKPMGEALLMGAVLLGIYSLIFLEPISLAKLRLPLGYLCVPLLIWPAFRFEQRGAVTAAFGTGVIAIVGTINNCGPFSQTPTNDALLVLQFFLGITSMTALVLGAAVNERRRWRSCLMQKTRELARSNADLEQFACVASHDLQEPLRMVSTYCQLIESRYGAGLDDEGRTFLRYSVEGARRMRVLIQDLLAYGRVGGEPTKFILTDCEQIVGQTISDLSAVVLEKNSVITRGPLPSLKVDALQISLLFQNLLINAMKYCDQQPPRMHVSAVKSGTNWVFSVADNGIGIQVEHQQRIFLLFQRLHSKDEYPGTGIGLAICKKIVEFHGGTIWVDSVLGKGSVFSFTLPHK